jgi:murein DD-endopeptidase MepM/ murein hydrolase activator NlpD
LLKMIGRIAAGLLLAAIITNVLPLDRVWPDVYRSSILPVGRVADPVLPLVREPTLEPEVTLHTVLHGDTLASIAARYGVDAVQLAIQNGLRNPDRIYPGQLLQLPVSRVTFYTIKRGDTISEIARAFGVGLRDLCRVNAITDPDRIWAGEKIKIPQDAAAYSVPAYAARASAAHIRLAWPLLGPISSGFGQRWGQMHEGLDIAVPYGTDVCAARGGTVSFAGRKGSYGNLVIIDHGSDLETCYAHLSRILVDAGMEVVAGEVIARSGTSGRSTGPHLHFEVRVATRPVDPRKLLP